MHAFNVTVGFALTFTLAAQVTLARPAHAQGVATSDERGGYRYVFDDDPMRAGGLTANDARVRVLPHSLRQTLIRPRVTFVPQMLASVEDL
jgi:hypothetical protein